MKHKIPKKSGEGPTRRNLPAEERRREMLDAALDLFSQKGVGITVQELADRIKVTQPLVHRYFPTKADLISAIRSTLHNAHWDPQWQEIIEDDTRDLSERIKTFYSAYLPHLYNDRWYRGFWYATLADPTFAQAYVAHVHDELLVSIANETRRAFGFASIQDVPVFEREMELIWGMHSTVIFVGIRRYVYNTPVSSDLAAIISDQVRAYMAVAPLVLAELMPNEKPQLTENPS